MTTNINIYLRIFVGVSIRLKPTPGLCFTPFSVSCRLYCIRNYFYEKRATVVFSAAPCACDLDDIEHSRNDCALLLESGRTVRRGPSLSHVYLDLYCIYDMFHFYRCTFLYYVYVA